jgi:hypothetical protein
VKEADSRENQRAAGELRRGERLPEDGEGDEPGHDGSSVGVTLTWAALIRASAAKWRAQE